MQKTGKGRLDRSRSYGEIYGSGQARYEQDHKQFDARGHVLIPAGAATVEAPEPAAKPIPPLPPTFDDSEAPAAPIDDDLSTMSMSQLRSAYIDEFDGKKARVGLTKPAIANLIREHRALRAA